MSGKPSKLVVGLGIFVGLAAIGQVAQMATGETAVEERPRPKPPAASRSAQNEPAQSQTPTPAAPQPAEPTATQLAMDEAYFKAAKRNPAADNYERVARKFKNTAEDVLESVSAVAEYRAALLAAAKRSITGVVGDLDIKEVTRTDLGAHTALVSFTATRCPDGDPRRDKQLEFLVTTALKKLATGPSSTHRQLPGRALVPRALLRPRPCGVRRDVDALRRNQIEMTGGTMMTQHLCLAVALVLGGTGCVARHRPSGHEMMQASLEKQRAERAQERETIRRNQEEHARKKEEWQAYAKAKREQQRQWLEAHPDCALLSDDYFSPPHWLTLFVTERGSVASPKLLPGWPPEEAWARE